MNDRTLPRALVYRLALLALLYLTALSIAGRLWPDDVAGVYRYLLAAGAAGVLHLALAMRFVPHNRDAASGRLWPSFGVANWLTLLRGLLNSLLAGFVPVAQTALAAEGWTIAALYTVSALLDITDGAVARVTRRPTAFGARLDMAYDALGLLIVVVLGIALGDLPLWFILVGLARYLFVGGLVLDRRTDQPLHALPPADSRRIAASTMMGFLSVVLWPNIGAPYTRLAALFFGGYLLTGFVRDWLVVSGRLDADGVRYRLWYGRYQVLMQRWLPLLLRLTVLLLLAGGYVPLSDGSAIALIGLIGALMVVTGSIGRLGGLLLLLPAVFGMGTLVARLLLEACALGVVLWGSGRLALWQPEERLWQRRG